MISDNAARLIECYFTKWLRNTDVGRDTIARLGAEGAMDALWELLNAGFIKLVSEDDTIIDIQPCNPPAPPEKPIPRPAQRTH